MYEWERERLAREGGKPARSSSRPRERLGNRALLTLLRASAGQPIVSRPVAGDLRSTDLRDDDRLQQAFDNQPPIRFGASGDPVRKVQQALADVGFSLPRSTQPGGGLDGVFGDETLKIVRGFQKRQGIAVDGEVGHQVLGELDGLLTGMVAPGTPTPTAASSISTVDVRPQSFKPCGGFDWAINWNTDGKNGYIVQEITKTVAGNFCSDKSDAGLSILDDHYWEAWRVQSDGSVHGSDPNDTFGTGLNAEGITGSWTITGNVFWVSSLDAAANFRFNNVETAGGLLSTRTPPDNLGSSLLVRRVGGTWTCCGDDKSHVPMTFEDPKQKEQPK